MKIIEKKIKKENELKVFYRHGKTIKGIRFTICMIVDSNKIVTFNYSRCSKRDQFSKKIGRNIAYGRALKDYNFTKKLLKNKFERNNNEIQIKPLLNKYFNSIIKTL